MMIYNFGRAVARPYKQLQGIVGTMACLVRHDR